MYDELNDEVETKGVSYSSTPFKVGIPIKNIVIIGNMDKVNALTDSGRLVLKYVASSINYYEQTCKLVVPDICKAEWNEYNATLATRVRRGIRNLLANEVIAKTTRSKHYWVNKSVVWR